MTAFVSLFRGINVGGHHKVPMAELKALHEALDFKNVSTYIQSGNVAFTSDHTDPSQIPGLIEDAFAQNFGYRVNVLVRTSTELQAIIDNNPFAHYALKEPKWLVVLFLPICPEPTALEDFQKLYPGPEELYLAGQELYIFYPDSIGHSKLPQALLEKKLKTTGTARNWNTVLQLQKLTQS